jgi:hypothetical protein
MGVRQATGAIIQSIEGLPESSGGKQSCHSSPDASRRWLISIIELVLIDFLTREMVGEYAGAQMACP